jgi:GNAT superfamily N-acetyltransferase
MTGRRGHHDPDADHDRTPASHFRVGRAYQRRGLGALVMRGLLERCWQAGCYKVMLLSGVRRTGAHAFYQALGFDRDAKQAFVITRPIDGAGLGAQSR